MDPDGQRRQKNITLLFMLLGLAFLLFVLTMVKIASLHK